MAETVNDSLTKISAELKETNLRFDNSVNAYTQMVNAQGVTQGVLKGIGGGIKENIVKSSSGFQSFISQMEQLPVFGAISGIAKTLGGKAFSVLRQRKEDANLAKQLGITKEEVAIRRKEQELLKAQSANNEQLLNAAQALGYNSDQFEEMTNAAANEEAGAAAVEEAREQRRGQERLVSAVESVGDGIDGLEVGDDEESKGLFGGILDSVKGFIPAIGAALTTLGTTLMGGLVALGTKIVLALKGGLGGLGRIMRKIPGGRALGNIFKKSLGGIAKLGTAGAGLLSTGASAAGAGVKTAGGMAGTALKGIGKAARFIPGAGLAVTAAMGLFDGITAGFKEYSESGSFTSALKEGTAGALSGITFGLISQETISNGMSAIGDFASNAWSGFTGIVGDAVGGIKDIGSKIIGSAVDGFENLTGLDVPENLSEVKDMVGNALSSAAEGFNNLTGLSIPTNLTELKDTVSSTFDNIGAGFTNLTGIEVPTFDDLSAKVGAFADNMKDNIAKGWESVTNMASDAWGGVKSFFGFGDDDVPVDTKELDAKIAAAKERMEKFDAGENAYYGFDTQQKRDADAALVKQLEQQKAELSAGQAPTTPSDYPIQYSKLSDGKYYYVYNKGEGQIEVAPNQEEAKRIYESASISAPENGGRTIQQTSTLNRSNSTADQIARDYMKNNGGNTTVVNAPNNSTTVAGGGSGGAIIPASTRDNSSAAQAGRNY